MADVLIYSGGMDSFTLLHDLLKQHDGDLASVNCLIFNYGQLHVREVYCAMAECKRLKRLPHNLVRLANLRDLLPGSALTDDTVGVPHGHYKDETMRMTIVPNRNMIMLSIAIGHAVAIGANRVLYAAHSGDHAIYPDCRPEFVQAMNEVARVANYQAVSVEAPYLHMSKANILEHGINSCGLMAADYGRTWTCYHGDVLACGKCGACTERLEAFNIIGHTDPLEYAPRQKQQK